MNDKKTSYDSWHKRRANAEETQGFNLQSWHRVVDRRLPDLNHKKVLEIGCGRGDFAIYLAQKYPEAEITATDFSDEAIEIAKSRATKNQVKITFQVENAEKLQIPADTYDWIISCECMEHVPHPPAMAREMYRVLKPGGHFILTTENYFNGMVLAWIVAWWRKQPFDSGSGVQPIENFFLFWKVRRILESAGLRVRHMESNIFQWFLLPRTAPKRLCTNEFRNPALNRLFRPFGRHFTFQGIKKKK